ncbi:Protein of unknown function (DUF3102) [Desulfosporosinus orientis DSM 765]|uniref:Uncharacterized protein n=1 Tax=Desulfosporosinus orientis (strain ATCC 19365 / DSM 765 / NCIMB 8382 / VKM B-1628 / Singapore I) TaxID=768706 RepID=G7WF99_DESOD|nr:DUF3102 domain-containing protein [Desulfosporosinus orientis]AET67985.1 Protein of unknown function (DUF3102) [Desulfosporosinus orientis DSM 765]
MGDIIPERTSFLIAAEINIIKHQTEKMVLNNFIEIGRRLAEAKGLIKYGEWGKWLKEEVGFSLQQTSRIWGTSCAYRLSNPRLYEYAYYTKSSFTFIKG